jgi:hypothetical protein
VTDAPFYLPTFPDGTPRLAATSVPTCAGRRKTANSVEIGCDLDGGSGPSCGAGRRIPQRT